MEAKMQELEKQAVMVIVQFGNQMMIGMGCEDVLFRPRVILRSQEGGLVLSPILGEPEFMQIGTYQASWEPKMEDPIRVMYIQATTGLLLAKPGQKIPDLVNKNPKAN